MNCKSCSTIWAGPRRRKSTRWNPVRRARVSCRNSSPCRVSLGRRTFSKFYARALLQTKSTQNRQIYNIAIVSCGAARPTDPNKDDTHDTRTENDVVELSANLPRSVYVYDIIKILLRAYLERVNGKNTRDASITRFCSN